VPRLPDRSDERSWPLAAWPPFAPLPGRTDQDELTVADLTGLGIQDAAIAALITRLAEQQDAGRPVMLGES